MMCEHGYTIDCAQCLKAQVGRLLEGIEDAKYTLSCPVSGSIDKAISILAALEPPMAQALEGEQ